MSNKPVSDSTSVFADLLKEYFGKVPQINDLVKGKVISIDRGEVRVDINGIIVGVVRGDELFSESKEFADTKVGDEVEATVVDLENEYGEMELSFRIAGNKLVWDRMEDAKKSGAPTTAKVIQANKGGLMLQVDALIGFLPVSQLNPEHYPRVPGGDKNRILDHLKQFIGHDLRVRIFDVNPDEEKLILSEKVVWEDEQKSILDSYKIGDTVEGEISALTPFGAFMKFGNGLEGLIHISEIVWQRIDHPKDILKAGDQVKAQIIDLNKSKIYLSLKRLIDDPWKAVKDRYKVGQTIEGEIHKIEPFGLMVRLDDQIHGLAHISDLSETPIADSRKFLEQFKIGEIRKFDIISMEPAEHRLGLSVEGVAGRKLAKKTKEKAEEKPEEKPEEKTEEKTEEKPV
ncbi:MAG: S1 RNA-binding domain-containing protein [Patescibacteria group bacterium]